MLVSPINSLLDIAKWFVWEKMSQGLRENELKTFSNKATFTEFGRNKNCDTDNTWIKGKNYMVKEWLK